MGELCFWATVVIIVSVVELEVANSNFDLVVKIADDECFFTGDLLKLLAKILGIA